MNEQQATASKARKQGSSRGWILALVFVTLVASVTGWLGQNKVVRPLINDEAVELIQGVGMPLDKFYFFTPETAYPGGSVDIVESLYPYIVRFTLKSDGAAGAQADELRPVRSLFFAFYAVGCVVFTWTVGRAWGAGWAAAAGTALATSSFLLVINHTVTRNGMSVLWACLVVAVLAEWVRRSEKNKPGGKYGAAFCLALFLVMGCWTYTSFRLLAAAAYAALVIDWWCSGKNKRDGLCVLGSGLLFGGVLLGLMAWNSDSLMIILQRGGYAVGEGGGYFARFALTLLTPFHHPDNRWTPFVVEDVHVLVGGAVLSRWLAVFFALGWVAAWSKPGRLERMAATIWTTGMALCAVAGPNFKYLLPFLPFALLLAVSGLRISTDFLSAKLGKAKLWRTMVAVIVIGAAGAGIDDFFHRYPEDQQNEGNRVAGALADVAGDQVKAGAPHVLVQPGRGIDVMRWKLRRLRATGQVSVYANTEMLFAEIETKGVAPGTVLLIDYPVEALMQRPGAEKLPATLKVINARLLPGF